MTYPQQPFDGSGQHSHAGPSHGHYGFNGPRYGGGFGSPPPPPPKRNTAAVVAVIAAVVLLLGGLGITGFVAPGFLLGSDDTDGKTTTTTPPATTTAPTTATTTPTSPRKPSTTAKRPERPGTPTAGGKPVPQEAVAVMQAFLDAVNGGDAAKAAGLLCADAIKSPDDVAELVGHDPDLAIDTRIEGHARDNRSVQMYLRGTAKGQKIEGPSGNLWVVNYDGPWCLHAFRVVVI